MNCEGQTVPSNPFDVVVLVASAGGHSAISTILRDLPADFSVPLVVMQHLGPESTSTAELYSRSVLFPVAWIHAGAVLTPGTVLVCPPRSFVDLLPDGTFVIAPNERGALNKPRDHF